MKVLVLISACVGEDVLTQGEIIDLSTEQATMLAASNIVQLQEINEAAVLKPLRRNTCKITQRLDVRNLHNQQPNQ